MEKVFQMAKKIHFIGVGGIGLSAIARMMLLEGRSVSGSDRVTSEVTHELEKHGARIVTGSQKAENIPEKTDLVIYTVAIPEDNPELVEAKRCGIPMMTYPTALGFISKEKFTIAVSGTHGKTTTTAMVGKLLVDAGLDPTILVGSLIKDPNNSGDMVNYVAGKSGYFVVEADEYRRSFLNLTPKILIINNLDEDHLDYYEDLEDIQGAFIELVQKLGPDGYLICNMDDPHLEPILEKVTCAVIDYPSLEVSGLSLKVPGAHNMSNAKAALAVAAVLLIDRDIAVRSLNGYEGAWRRFQYKGTMKSGAILYDDYAHNPQKVQAALAGAREKFPTKRIVAVFQPHLYSRTKLLLDEFSHSFSDADLVIIAPIYAAREADDPSISSEMLAHAVREAGQEAVALDSFEAIIDEVAGVTDGASVVVTIGAGDIHKVAEAAAAL